MMKELLLTLLIFSCVSCIFQAEKEPTDNLEVSVTDALLKEQVPYPHPDNFLNELNHGKFYLKNKQSCSQCHAEVKEHAPKSGPNCTSCHESFPHIGKDKKNWIADHGKFFLKTYDSYKPESNKCASCHDSLLERSAGLKKLRCDSCHVKMPHNQMPWVYYAGPDEVHHGDFIKTNGISDCRKCHGKDIHQTDVNEGNQGKAMFCSKCHTAE